ncbi:MAG: DNA translocase FtsK [Bacteroidales bacterium]|nr:DNA translocase FtsK [Bacteroidales bacterium]
MPAKSNKLKSNSVKQKPVKKGKKKPLKVSNSFKAVLAFIHNRMFQQVFGLTLLLLVIFLGISFTSYLSTWKVDDHLGNYPFWELLLNQDQKAVNFAGKIGALTSIIFIKEYFGVSAYFFVIYFFFAGLKLLWPRMHVSGWKVLRICVIGLVWVSVSFAFLIPDAMGGLLPGLFGTYLNGWLTSLIGKVGTGLLLLFVLVLVLLYNGFFKLLNFKFPSFSVLVKNTEKLKKRSGKKESEGDKYNLDNYVVNDDEDEIEDGIEDEDRESVVRTNKGKIKKDSTIELEINHEQLNIPPVIKSTNEIDFTIENPVESSDIPQVKPDERVVKQPAVFDKRQGLDTEYDPRLDLPHFKFPPLDLLNDYGSAQVKVQKEELEANKNKIVETLNHYKIEIQKIKATIGPTVTLYEIVPSPGIRVSKIKNLEDDIALSLSALGIRIIAPIPGKGTIGIEVPNQNPDTVSMKSVLASEKFQETNFQLPIGMGRTISNEVFVADLTKMPHLLMAGATGQGKSVGLNAVIASLLYKKHPAELKFVMVDPKKVELTLFSKIERHYLAKLPDSEEAIITDTRKVVRTLNSLGIEMDTRYELLKDAQVRNIKEYNAKFLQRKLNPLEGHHFMPYIVLVIDEFADLIMTAGKEIEIPLTRLAQLARAIGIHLIIATQRPSVNIITGSIKANFPARIAFRVISKVDSRTILDSPGADQLIGRGDMLLSTGSDLIRMQCAFIDTPEIDKLTEYIGSQRAYPHAYQLPEFVDENDDGPAEFDPEEKDALFEEAARILVQSQQGSTSLLQRKMKIGYNRAGRIIDQLEAAGVVGPFEGSKAREVIIKTEFDLEQFLKTLDEKF